MVYGHIQACLLPLLNEITPELLEFEAGGKKSWGGDLEVKPRKPFSYGQDKDWRENHRISEVRSRTPGGIKFSTLWPRNSYGS